MEFDLIATWKKGHKKTTIWIRRPGRSIIFGVIWSPDLEDLQQRKNPAQDVKTREVEVWTWTMEPGWTAGGLTGELVEQGLDSPASIISQYLDNCIINMLCRWVCGIHCESPHCKLRLLIWSLHHNKRDYGPLYLCYWFKASIGKPYSDVVRKTILYPEILEFTHFRGKPSISRPVLCLRVKDDCFGHKEVDDVLIDLEVISHAAEVRGAREESRGGNQCARRGPNS